MGPLKWYFDTSVLIPAAVTRHPHNAAAFALLEESFKRKHQEYVSAHSLAEVYSVLTRAPFKPRIYPDGAWRIIEQMFLPRMTLVTLSPNDYVEVVRRCALNGWAGGRIHDAVHLRCAEMTGCDHIYTFDVKDFRALAPASLTERISAP
jgi:predicted nucleic acid-binding protein